MSSSHHHRLRFPDAGQRFAARMGAGIAVPCTVAVPYAIYIYYGLDRAPGAAYSLAALIIALGTTAYSAGGLLGRLNAEAALRACARLGVREWQQQPEMAARGATLAVCAFFASIVLAVGNGHPELALLALAVPGLVALAWLSLLEHGNAPRDQES